MRVETPPVSLGKDAFQEKTTPAVLSFLRETQIVHFVAVAALRKQSAHRRMGAVAGPQHKEDTEEGPFFPLSFLKICFPFYLVFSLKRT